MLEIMDNVKEMIEMSIDVLQEELDRIEENRKFTEYEKTIESTFCKLCTIQIELKIGSTKFHDLTESELDKLIDELLNDNKERFACKIQLLNN